MLHAVVDVGIDGTTGFTFVTGSLHVKWDQTWGICTRSAGKLERARSRLYRSQILRESSRRDLHNALLCTVLNAQHFVQKSLNFLPIFSQNLAKFDKISLDLRQILFGRLK